MLLGAPSGYEPPVFLLGVGTIFIALSASWAAWHFRSLQGHLLRDIAMTVSLVGVAVFIFVATLIAAGLFGLGRG